MCNYPEEKQHPAIYSRKANPLELAEEDSKRKHTTATATDKSLKKIKYESSRLITA